VNPEQTASIGCNIKWQAHGKDPADLKPTSGAFSATHAKVPPFDLTEQLHQLGEALEDAVLKGVAQWAIHRRATIASSSNISRHDRLSPRNCGCNSGTDFPRLALRGLASARAMR